MLPSGEQIKSKMAKKRKHAAEPEKKEEEPKALPSIRSSDEPVIKKVGDHSYVVAIYNEIFDIIGAKFAEIIQGTCNIAHINMWLVHLRNTLSEVFKLSG